MPAVSDNEAQNFVEKSKRGQEIMTLMKKISKKKEKTQEDEKQISDLIQELNKINEWFQKTSK